MSEPNDFQTDEMIRETKIEAAASAMAELMAQVTGREEDAELIKEGYREMFAPKRTAPAMGYGTPITFTPPKISPIFREEAADGSIHVWDFEKLLGPAYHVRFLNSGTEAAYLYACAADFSETLRGTVALRAWAFLEERRRFIEDQQKHFEAQMMQGGPA